MNMRCTVGLEYGVWGSVFVECCKTSGFGIVVDVIIHEMRYEITGSFTTGIF